MSDNLRPLKARVDELLTSYASSEGTNRRGAVRDMLTELIHIAHDEQIDFDDLVADAKEVAREEFVT